MSLKLLTIPYSHYCERARWGLDYAGLDYIEEGHAPFFHAYYNRKAGAGRMVPALVTEDRVINGSDRILEFINTSGTLLYPDQQSRDILSWEARFDRTFGILSRVWAYIHLQSAPELLHEILETGTPKEYPLLKAFVPKALETIVKLYRAYPHRLARVEQELNAALDQCDFILRDQRPFFMGETFTAADISLCALAGVLVMPHESGFTYPALQKFPEAMQSQMLTWRKRPVGQYILRMYANHRTGFGV